MEERVLAQFAEFAGLSEEESLTWEEPARACLAEISGQLKSGFDKEAQSSLLCTAAAALLFYRYVLIRQAGGEESFSAGEIAVKRGDGTQAARLFWEQARGALAPWLESPEFVFERVKT